MVQETKFRQGNTAEHGTFTGAIGEITVDTDKNTVVIHDGSTVGGFPLASDGGEFDTGTTMFFQQTSAPTGWTKETTHNNKSLRVISGSVSSGGSTAFTSVLGASTTGAHTLTIAEMPAHTHKAGASVNNSDFVVANVMSTSSTGLTTSSTGGGGSHDHTLSLDLQYVDLIIASKD